MRYSPYHQETQSLGGTCEAVRDAMCGMNGIAFFLKSRVIKRTFLKENGN